MSEEMVCENCGHTMTIKTNKKEMNKQWSAREMLPDDELSFGKYRGKTLRVVYEQDLDYYEWLINNNVVCLVEAREEQSDNVPF